MNVLQNLHVGILRAKVMGSRACEELKGDVWQRILGIDGYNLADILLIDLLCTVWKALPTMNERTSGQDW